jgi:hypothetical protein
MTPSSRESPDEADLYVKGQLISTGEVVLYPVEGQGVFWPHDGKRLNTTYPNATLNIAGAEDTMQIKDVHQCLDGPLCWAFLIV